MKKLIICGIAAALSFGALAEQIDGHTVLYCTGGGGYWDGVWNWNTTTSTTTQQKWVDDCVAVLYGGNVYLPKDKVCTAYQLKTGASMGFFRGHGYAAGQLRIGAGGVDVTAKNLTIGSLQGPEIILAASQVWTNGSETARSINMNDTSYLSPEGKPFVLAAENDVVLTLGGSLTWNFNGQAALSNADVVVNSPAVLSVNYYSQAETIFRARTLTLDGSASKTVSSGGVNVLNVGTLQLRNGGKLTVNSGASAGVPLDALANRIIADQGTGALDGVLTAASDGVYSVEAADDATLTLSPTWKGDPARLALVGAGTIVFGGSGVAPIITSVEGFTGTIQMAGPCSFADGVLESLQGKVVVSADATVQVDYPKALDASKFEIQSGKTLTIRYASPRAPVAYPDGLTLATGVGESIPEWLKYACWDSTNNEEYGTQGAELSVDNGSVKLVRYTTPLEKTAADISMTSWVNGSVVTVASGNTALKPTKTNVTVDGFRWTTFSGYFACTDKTLHLGKGGISYTGSSTDFRMWRMNEFRLVESQTWTGAGGMLYLGDYQAAYPYFPTLFTADENVVLTITGPLTVALNCPGDLHTADVIVNGTNGTTPTKLIVDYSKFGTRDVMLNARSLTLEGNAYVTMQSKTEVDDGYCLAKKVAFSPNGTGMPTLSFVATQSGVNPIFDLGAIEVSGTGESLISGAAFLRSQIVPVSIGEGATLSCAAVFANAPDYPGVFELSGSGAFKISNTSQSFTPIFTPASVSGFAGTVRVADGAVLNVSGAVDFPSLVFEGNATVTFDLDAGSKIVDWSKVTFPAEGKTVTLYFYRKDAIVATESPLDVGMNLSSVTVSDRAKLAAMVEGQAGGYSAYSVAATPSIAQGGQLALVLTSKMGEDNSSIGGMVWIGRDWADARVAQNWVIYPNGTKKEDFDPDAHPTDLADVKAKLRGSGIYSSSNWHLDLGGETLECKDGRANNSSGARYFGVSNGIFKLNSLMVSAGRFDVENGASLIVDASISSSQAYPAYFTFGGSSVSDPFVFEVHSNASAQIGHELNYLNTSFNNIRYQVDAGGAFSFYPRLKNFVSKAKTTFVNEGELSFPLGLVLSNMSAAVTGAVSVVQKTGTLHLTGAFELTRGEGCGSTCDITFVGGTTVLSSGVLFSGWDFAVADNADFSLEIPKGGDFATDAFVWGTYAALVKKGEGILRLADADNVAGAGLTLAEGLVVADANGTVVGGVTFAGGAIGLDSDAVGNGLTVTNGTVSGACRVRALGRFSEAVPFLTIASAADPGYTAENVVFENARGKAITGKITKESVTVGDVECVRYSAAFSPNGVILIVR